MQVTTIGLDLAKNVFQIHGIDRDEKVVVRKQLRRGQVLRFFQDLSPCLVGLEACATAHHWARELTKLGHTVRLMLRSKKWSWLKAWAMQIARRRGMKKAIVALARRLAVIMHRIWVDGTEFRWTRDQAAAAA